MKHEIVKIKSVTVPELNKIKAFFEDYTEQTFDLEPILYGPMYDPLKDSTLFRAVKWIPKLQPLYGQTAPILTLLLYTNEIYENELKERALPWSVQRNR